MYFPEAATQTFKRGEVVYLVGGKVTEIAGDSPGQILGVSADDASGTTNTSTGVWIANDDTIFEANYSNDSQSGAATNVNIVGLRKILDRDTTNSRVYVSNSGTTPRVTILDLSEKDEAGDTGGRVLFQFLRQFSQLFSTS
jgi:hypothetical protein